MFKLLRINPSITRLIKIVVIFFLKFQIFTFLLRDILKRIKKINIYISQYQICTFLFEMWYFKKNKKKKIYTSDYLWASPNLQLYLYLLFCCYMKYT